MSSRESAERRVLRQFGKWLTDHAEQQSALQWPRSEDLRWLEAAFDASGPVRVVIMGELGTCPEELVRAFVRTETATGRAAGYLLVNESALIGDRDRERKNAEARADEMIENTVKANAGLVFFHIHSLVGAGAHRDDPTGDLTMRFLRNLPDTIPVVGTTTQWGWHRLAGRPEVQETFQYYQLRELVNTNEICAMAEEFLTKRGHTQLLSAFNRGVVSLASTYFPGYYQPGATLRLLDFLARRGTAGLPGGDFEFQVEAAVSAFSEEWMSQTWTSSGIEARLAQEVFGQTAAVQVVAGALMRLRWDLTRGNRPAGRFLLAGPTGTGKTELAKKVARLLFGREEELLRLDMNLFLTAESATALVSLADARRESINDLIAQLNDRPYQVILFDEVDKGNPEVVNFLLRLLDEGVLEAGGRRGFFGHAIVFLTANIQPPEEELSGGASLMAIESWADARFGPAFVGRLSGVVEFHGLTAEALAAIARKELTGPPGWNGLERRGIRIELTDGGARALATPCVNKSHGARELLRRIESELLTQVADLLEKKSWARGQRAAVAGGQVTIGAAENGVVVTYKNGD